jgi:hypothetical protein
MPIGKLKYAITNFLAGDLVTLYSSSEDDLYNLGKLYNVRPSYPFRFEGLGTTSGAIPEYICADLGEAKRPTFTAIFNHNFGDTIDTFKIQACVDGCPLQSGACAWDVSGGPGFEEDLEDRLIADFNNAHASFTPGADYQYWRWPFIDSANPNPYLEIGELFLGEWQELPDAKLQPGRADGPEFFEATQITDYGQIWSSYYSEAEAFEIEIKNQNNPAQVSDLRKFLSDVKQANGKFIFIPDDHYKFVYYVHLQNLAGFGQQLVKGELCELYSWKLSLRTLVKGISLLG